MTARKTEKKIFTKTNDVGQFTLASPEETTDLNTPSLPDTAEVETFWYTKQGKIWMSFFGVSIVLALVVGLFMYRQGVIKSTPIPPFITPLEVPQVSPTPTPQAIDISKYKIEVLNGSDIRGEAAKVKGLLEAENFTVLSIGNAQPYQKTVIQAKKTVPKEFLDKLKGIIEKLYILDDIKVLDESEKFDAIIIIGNLGAK